MAFSLSARLLLCSLRRAYIVPSITRHDTYDATMRAFRWQIPAKFNMGTACVDRHVQAGHGNETGLIFRTGDSERPYSYCELKLDSDRLAVGTYLFFPLSSGV